MRLDGKSRGILAILGIICAVLIVAGRLYLDIKIAKFIAEEVGNRFLCSSCISKLPDLLLLLVCLITLISWAARLYLTRKPTRRINTDFFEYMGSALPAVFISKTVLKDVFGGTNTRTWLVHPSLLEFHWFQGGGDFQGFPSGHMAIFTVLLFGIGRYFPRLRPPCIGLLIALALALMLTEYHFLSDIVAGFSVGVIIDLIVSEGIPFAHRLAGRSGFHRKPESI